jgi:hypothetical protein
VISERRRVSTLLGFATLGLGIALAVQPVSVETIVGAYVLAVAAIVIASLTRRLASHSRHDTVSQFEYAISRRPAQQGRPAELVRVEREITLGVAGAGNLHVRLLPLLREAAAARIGSDFERRPERARALLGDEAWELLRPDRPAPIDRNAPGVPMRSLQNVVDTLEHL